MNLDPAAPEVKIIAQCEGRPPVSPGAAGSPICGVYGIYCATNEKWYIGQAVSIQKRWWRHGDDLEKNIHSNKHLQSAWNKYGARDFLWVVLANIFLEELLDLCEVAAISEFQAMSPTGFNLKTGGANGRPSAETRALWSKNRRGRPLSPEHRKNVIAANNLALCRTPGALARSGMTRRGRKHSKEAKQRISAAGIGRKQSTATIARRSASLMGRVTSKETRAKISAARTGIPLSEEHRLALRAAKKARYMKRLSDSGHSWGWKPCTQCHEWKPFSEFALADRMIDGHRSSCKECVVRRQNGSA